MCLYRSSRQSLEELKLFKDNLELNVHKTAKNGPFLIVLYGGLNAKLGKWYENDRTFYDGTKIDGIKFTSKLP